MFISLNCIAKGDASPSAPVEVYVPIAKIGLIQPMFIDGTEFETFKLTHPNEREPRMFTLVTEDQIPKGHRPMEMALRIMIDGGEAITVMESVQQISGMIDESNRYGIQRRRDFNSIAEFLWTEIG